MLKNIGEAVLYLAKQELAFRGHDESRTSLNQGNYRELLKVLGKFDSVFDRRLHGRLQATERPDSGGVFTGCYGILCHGHVTDRGRRRWGM